MSKGQWEWNREERNSLQRMCSPVGPVSWRLAHHPTGPSEVLYRWVSKMMSPLLFLIGPLPHWPRLIQGFNFPELSSCVWLSDYLVLQVTHATGAGNEKCVLYSHLPSLWLLLQYLAKAFLESPPHLLYTIVVPRLQRNISPVFGPAPSGFTGTLHPKSWVNALKLVNTPLLRLFF